MGVLDSLVFSIALRSANAAGPTRIANLNWHSSDLLGDVYRRMLEYRGVDVESSDVEYTSSTHAMAGLRQGLVDIVPECWNDCRENASFKSLGVTGTENVYMPLYLSDRYPELRNFSDLELIRRLVSAEKIWMLNAPESWGGVHDIVANICQTLSMTCVDPYDDQDALARILEALKFQQPFVFYWWAPHLLTSAYDVTRIILPISLVSNEEGSLKHPTELVTSWHPSLSQTTPGDMLEGRRWNISMQDMSDMMQAMLHSLSLTADTTSPAYRLASSGAAAAWICDHVDDNIFYCRQRDKWPRLKGDDFPQQLLLKTKNCVGFVKCTGSNGELLTRPSGGYAIDHFHEILRLIGYQKHEYDIRCWHDGTWGMVRDTGKNLADASHACITITSARQDVVDFTSAFYTTGLQILMKRPDSEDLTSYLWIIFEPFQWDTWLLLSGAVVLIGILVGILEYLTRKRLMTAAMEEDNSGESPPYHSEESIKSENSRSNPSNRSSKQSTTEVRGMSFAAGLISVTQAVRGRQKDADKTLKSSFARATLPALSLVSFLIFALYEANLAASFTLQRMEEPIQGIASLRGKSVGIVCQSSVEDWLKTHEPKIKITCLESQLQLSAHALGGGYAVYDAPVLERLAQEDCRLIVVGKIFFEQEYGLALPKGSPLLEPLSAAVTLFREDGSHTALWKKHFSSDETCQTSRAHEAGQIAPQSLIGVFALVGIFMVGSLILLLLDRTFFNSFFTNLHIFQKSATCTFEADDREDEGSDDSPDVENTGVTFHGEGKATSDEENPEVPLHSGGEAKSDDENPEGPLHNGGKVQMKTSVSAKSDVASNSNGSSILHLGALPL